MAISSTSVLECRTGGNDQNGGGFNGAGSSPGTDWSVQDSPQVTIDGSAISATVFTTTTQVTLVGRTVLATDNRNFLQINSGTATAGVYEITAVDTVNNRWTLDRSAGTQAQTVVGRMGGGFASPGKAAAVAASGNVIYLRQSATPYTIANGTVNTSGNKFTLTNVSMVGYATNRYIGNTDTQPVLDAGAASMTMLTTSGSGGLVIENLSFTNSAANASVVAVAMNSQMGHLRRTSIAGVATPLSGSGSPNRFTDLQVSGCGVMTFSGNGSHFARCVNVGSTGNGWVGNGNFTFDECFAIGAATQGFVLGLGGLARNCVAYNDGANGFAINSAFGQCVNCIAYGNTGTSKGYAITAGLTSGELANCAAGANAVADYDAGFSANQKVNCVTLTADPFVAKAGNNFALNNTAGGGAACRAAGIPGAFAGIATTGYRDIGAAQHQDSPAINVQRRRRVR